MRQIPRCDPDAIFHVDANGFGSFTAKYRDILRRDMSNWSPYDRKPGSRFLDYNRSMLEREGEAVGMGDQAENENETGEGQEAGGHLSEREYARMLMVREESEIGEALEREELYAREAREMEERERRARDERDEEEDEDEEAHSRDRRGREEEEEDVYARGMRAAWRQPQANTSDAAPRRHRTRTASTQTESSAATDGEPRLNPQINETSRLPKLLELLAGPYPPSDPESERQ